MLKRKQADVRVKCLKQHFDCMPRLGAHADDFIMAVKIVVKKFLQFLLLPTHFIAEINKRRRRTHGGQAVNPGIFNIYCALLRQISPRAC